MGFVAVNRPSLRAQAEDKADLQSHKSQTTVL